MKLEKMSVRARLALGFGTVLLLLTAVAATSLVQLSNFNRNVEGIAKLRMGQLITAGQVVNALDQINRSTANVLVLDDEKEVKQELAAVRANRDAVNDLLIKVSGLLQTQREKELFEEVKAALAAYTPHEDAFLKEADEGDYSSAKDIMLRSTRPAQLQLQEKIESFEQYQVSMSADEANKAAEAYDRTRDSVVILSALAILFGLAASALIIRSLRAELGGEPAYAKLVATRIAEGDLGMEVSVRAADSSSMLAAMRRMSQSLAMLVGEVAAGSRSVAATSAQIAQGNADLSQRTEEQAGTLEETASSMEELTTTVSQNAENARKANQLASGASLVAQKGGQVVGEVVSTMNGISDASRKIADIIGVIDAIAFQTNILALNAAVEAARAGDQGRGFAVVATEVRNLAQRSAAAAKEIKALIGDSVQRVEAGTRLVDAAGKTMGEIVSAVADVSALINEIAQASQEQSSGIEQVNQAISQMEAVVQQNASLVEEAAAATESMKQQADNLLAQVSRFRLSDEQRAHDGVEVIPAPVVPPPAPPVIAPIRVRPAATLVANGSEAAPFPARAAAKVDRGAWTTY